MQTEYEGVEQDQHDDASYVGIVRSGQRPSDASDEGLHDNDTSPRGTLTSGGRGSTAPGSDGFHDRRSERTGLCEGPEDEHRADDPRARFDPSPLRTEQVPASEKDQPRGRGDDSQHRCEDAHEGDGVPAVG